MCKEYVLYKCHACKSIINRNKYVLEIEYVYKSSYSNPTHFYRTQDLDSVCKLLHIDIELFIEKALLYNAEVVNDPYINKTCCYFANKKDVKRFINQYIKAVIIPALTLLFSI